MSEILDAAKSGAREGGASFSLANRLERLTFSICWALLARWTPVPFFHGWRRLLLRLFGAQMAKGTVVYPSAKVWLPRNLIMGPFAKIGPGVDCYNMAPITLGAYCTVSQRSFICAGNHDHRDRNFQLITAPVVIGDEAWIAAEGFVGPGVMVGEGAVLAARGCASRDLDAWTVYAGNPAVKVGERKYRDS